MRSARARLFGTTDEWITWLHTHGLKILFIIIVTLVSVWILRALSRKLLSLAGGRRDVAREQQLRTLIAVLNSAVTALIITMAALEILEELAIRIEPLIASAGVAGIAIGFGAQTLVKDVITGFFVLFDDQYRVGDTVRAAGVQGKVERLTLRRTILRDADGTVHFIPNSQLTVVSNLTRDWTLASLPVAVHYRESSERVIEVLKEAANNLRISPRFIDLILADPIIPGIERIQGDEVDYLVQVQVVPGSQQEVLRALRQVVKEHLERAGIEAWYPNLPSLAQQLATKPQ